MAPYFHFSAHFILCDTVEIWSEKQYNRTDAAVWGLPDTACFQRRGFKPIRADRDFSEISA